MNDTGGHGREGNNAGGSICHWGDWVAKAVLPSQALALRWLQGSLASWVSNSSLQCCLHQELETFMAAVFTPFLCLAVGSCSIAFASEYSVGQDDDSDQGHQECNEEDNFYYVSRIRCGRGECTLAP